MKKILFVFIEGNSRMKGEKVNWLKPLWFVLIITLVMIASLVAKVSYAQEPDARDPCPVSDVPPSAESITFPSEEHRSIQDALCDLQDGGVINLLPGTYFEKITIWGKQVEIRGTDNGSKWPVLQASDPTMVVPANEVEGVITVDGGGSLRLKKVRVVGGDAGILVNQLAGPVELEHATLERNGRGILHFSPAELDLKHVTFNSQLWNGISYVPIFDPQAQNCGGLNVSHLRFGALGGAGLYIRGCLFLVDQTIILDNLGGGIVAIASVGAILNSNINESRYWGILLVNTKADIKDTFIAFTTSGPISGGDAFGDGISIWTMNAPWAQGGPSPPSFVTLKNVSVYVSERAGLSSFGAHAALKNNTFVAYSFPLQSEKYDGYDSVFTDLGGNTCNQTECSAISSVLEPPPPVGGLE